VRAFDGWHSISTELSGVDIALLAVQRGRSSCFMFAVGDCSRFTSYKFHLCSVLIDLGHIWNPLSVHMPVPCLVALCRPARFFLRKWPFRFGFSSSDLIKHTFVVLFSTCLNPTTISVAHQMSVLQVPRHGAVICGG